MEFLEFVERIAVIVGNLFICLGVIVAICQLCLWKKQKRKDKEKSTIEFYQSIRDKIIELIKQIDTKFPNDQIINTDDVINDSGMLDAIKEYLSHMERLSVGLNAGIYDIVVFNKMLGISAARWFERLKEIVEYYRKNSRDPIAYQSFEYMVSKLRDLQGK